jgi:hypothetical protein
MFGMETPVAGFSCDFSREPRRHHRRAAIELGTISTGDARGVEVQTMAGVTRKRPGAETTNIVKQTESVVPRVVRDARPAHMEAFVAGSTTGSIGRVERTFGSQAEMLL